MSLVLPKHLIANLDAAFQREAKKLAIEISKVLKRPEKEVLDIIRKMEKIQYKIYDTDEHDISCPVFLSGSHVIQRCRRPCILGTNRCVHHQTSHVASLPSNQYTELTRCIASCVQSSYKNLLYNEETNLMYNENGDCIGEVCDDEDSCNKKVFYEFIYEDENSLISGVKEG